MNKEGLKEALIDQHKRLITELENKLDFTHSMVDLDEGDTIDPEDHSHQWESAEMEQLVKVQINRAKGQLSKLNSIDFSPKKSVGTGAFVQTDQMNFFIGLSTLPFEFEGMKVLGISEESPVYSIMAGKQKGQHFSISGNEHSILNIY